MKSKQSGRMNKKERLKKKKTHQRLQNHIARHGRKIKQGTIIARIIKPMEMECPNNWEKRYRMLLHI
jgi:hypothetical protein